MKRPRPRRGKSARLLLQRPRVDSVLIGAAQRDDPVREVWRRSGSVVRPREGRNVSARSSRCCPWRGVPLVGHVADQALRCPDMDRLAVTVGAGAEPVQAAIAGCDLSQVPVPEWEQGQSWSVKGAGTLCPRSPLPASPSAVLFLLADQPGVSPALLSALIQRHRRPGADRPPRHAGQRGNPGAIRPRHLPGVRSSGRGHRRAAHHPGAPGRDRLGGLADAGDPSRILMLPQTMCHPPRVRRMKTGLRGLGVFVSLW